MKDTVHHFLFALLFVLTLVAIGLSAPPTFLLASRLPAASRPVSPLRAAPTPGAPTPAAAAKLGATPAPDPRRLPKDVS